MQNQQPPRRRRPMTPEERAMAAERRRQKEILRRRAMRRYYAFLALLGALALAALVGLFFLIKAAAGWARGGQASSVSAAQSVSASAPPASSGEPAADPNAPADPALWSLILTNTTNPLPEGYAPELASVGSNSRNGEQFMDARVKEPLEQMFAAAKADGIELVARSAYRSTQEQTTLFNSMKQDYINQGMSEEEAFAATKQWRNEPGTSEHETGLAVDIVGAADINAALVESLEERDWAVWLREHAPEYGFILRYPEGREDITGFCFEPWHYRFVGRTLALQVRESGLTYDEFLARRAVDRPHTALCAGDMPLEAVPILLDGICWLPAQAVAAAFGRTAAISGDQLVLPAEEGSVVLTAGSLTGERDDRPFALSSLPFQWEGEFYLSLEDLCALLELTARREEGLISLIPRSAPSALLPEELPPIQPLPC